MCTVTEPDQQLSDGAEKWATSRCPVSAGALSMFSNSFRSLFLRRTGVKVFNGIAIWSISPKGESVISDTKTSSDGD